MGTTSLRNPRTRIPERHGDLTVTRHRRRHLRARRPSERRMAALLTSPTRRRKAPPLGSQISMTRRPVAAQLWRGGPFLTRVLVRTPIRGPTWASSLSIRIPAPGQHHSSRGSKTFTYDVWGASCMLPHLPLKILHFHPFRHLTPPRVRTRRVEKALPLSGASSKTIPVPDLGSRPIRMPKTCGKQGERCQHWATYL